jgi:hypothetical protein
MSSPDEAVSVGDINRDGYNDLVLVSSYCLNNGWGVLSLYLGHPWLNSEPVWTIGGRGWQNLVDIRTSAGLGDVNGDHVDDFAIGAWDDFDFDGWRGRCLILSGDTTLRATADDLRPAFPHDIQVSVFPNPFNATTTIQFEVPIGVSRVSLQLINVLGQTVHSFERYVTPGTMSFTLDGWDLSTGIYFLRVQARDLQATTKLMVLR